MPSFGHSFVKRHEEKQATDPWTFKSSFGLEQYIVTLKGFEGLNFGLKDSKGKEKVYAIVDSVFRF